MRGTDLPGYGTMADAEATRRRGSSPTGPSCSILIRFFKPGSRYRAVARLYRSHRSRRGGKRLKPPPSHFLSPIRLHRPAPLRAAIGGLGWRASEFPYRWPRDCLSGG